MKTVGYEVKYYVFILVGLGLMYLLPLMILVNLITSFSTKQLNRTGTQVQHTRPGGPQYIIDPLTGDYRQKDQYRIDYSQPPATDDFIIKRLRYMDYLDKRGVENDYARNYGKNSVESY